MATDAASNADDPAVLQDRVRRLEPATLTPILRRATNRDDVTPAEWDVTPLSGALGGSTAGLFRVSGHSPPHGSWSVVLKIVRPSAGNFIPGIGLLPAGFGDSPADYNYWRRETLAYESGLTADLSALGLGLRAPRFYGRIEDPTGAPNRAWLWLEDLRGTPGSQWTPERYVLAARHLGRFNGTYLSTRAGASRSALRGAPNPLAEQRRPLPAHQWLSRRWLRSWLTRWQDEFSPSIPDEVWAHPLVRLALPDPTRDRLQRLWDQREILLSTLERLPQTLAHLDANPGNLFGVPSATVAEETVVIDWSFVGICALGEELGQLLHRMLASNPAWHPRAAELRDSLFQGYLAGLRDVGWQATDDAIAGVRFAYLIHPALRWGLMVPARWISKLGESPTPDPQNRTPEERARQRAVLTHFLLDQADHAYGFLGSSAEL